jgi:uncharacterized protein YqgC (DUF456 family)
MSANVATASWLAVAAVLVVVGLAGLVLPGLPGAPLVFAGLFLAAWAEHFAYVGAGTLLVLALLAAATLAIDFLASAIGARRFGASPRAALGAALGGLVGIFFGLPGLLVGPFLGAVTGELTARRSLGAAARAGVGATLGLAVGLAARIALGFSMLAVFAFDRFVWH